jgi:hypothetical protein
VIFDLKLYSPAGVSAYWFCELTRNGRSPQQVTERLDRLIAKIRDIQRPHMNGEKPADVVVVSKLQETRDFG